MEFYDIFARHRFDIGINTQFKVQLTPLDNRPAYSPSLPAPINLKDDILVELALLHKYGIITTLPFSKNAIAIFAQRKPNGKLRLLVDLRKIKTLIAYDYINNNHPVSTLTVAAQHMAGKNLFCKLDCSQAYHCLQMAEQQSIELSSFIREYLDPVIKADQCAQYVDDIGIAANTPEQLIKNLQAVLQCLWMSTESWSQTQHGQMPFWSTRSRFPWMNNNNQRGCPSKTKDCQIPRKSVNFHDPNKHLNDILAF